MEAPYSLDLRERVVAAVAGGMSCAAAAEHYQVSHSSAIRPAPQSHNPHKSELCRSSRVCVSLKLFPFSDSGRPATACATILPINEAASAPWQNAVPARMPFGACPMLPNA
jgi:hypothetical protein